MIGAGFDAQVVHRLSDRMKRSLGRNTCVLQGLREVTRYGFTPIRLSLDSRETEAGNVIVSKGQLYRGGYTLALFDRCGPLSALMYGAALPLNLISRMPGLRLVRANDIRIVSADVPAQADGDPAEQAPLTVTNAPHPMQVVVA